jgi:hypothetical protein
VLKSDGTVIAWGKNNVGQANVPAGLRDVVRIAAGEHHTLALKRDGTVVAWGWTNDGRCNVPEDLTDVVDIAGGACHSLALKRDGTVVGWGSNRYGQISIPAGLSDVSAISAGYFFSVALKRDGTIAAWGINEYGQLDIPEGLSGVSSISAGAFHVVALRANGTVVAWGNDHFDAVSYPNRLSNVAALAGGVLALKRDGTVVQWGWNGEGQTKTPAGLSGVTAIAALRCHSLALRGTPARAAPESPARPVVDVAAPIAGDVGPGIVQADPAAAPADAAEGTSDAGTVGGPEPEQLVQARAVYRKHLAQFENEYAAELEEWVTNYVRDVKKAGIASQRAGDLEGWQAAVKEGERFSATRLIPENPPVGASDALRALQSRYRTLAVQAGQRTLLKKQDLAAKYLTRLAALKADATKAAKLEDALAYDAELKRFRGTVGNAAPAL